MNRDHAFAFGRLYRFAPRSLLRRGAGACLRWLQSRLDQELAWEAAAGFAQAATCGVDLLVSKDAVCINPASRGHVIIGNNVVVRGIVRVEGYSPGKIVVGDNVYLGDDTLLSCAQAITIGAWTLVAHGAQIFDNDSHPVDPASRQEDYRAVLAGGVRRVDAMGRSPVCIGERCWIGAGALVMKGVTIGDGAVVAAMAVVVNDVPPGVVVAGNPARIVRRFDNQPGDRTNTAD